MNIKVRVRANARREKFEILSDSSCAIAVREKAEGNAANGRARELIAQHFNVPLKAVRILKGHRAPSKVIAVP